MLKAVIIEDEADSRDALKTLLERHHGDVKVVGEATSIQEGLQLLDQEDLSTDIVFMDIELSDGQSFRLLDRLKTLDFHLIFVTAYNDFAIRAFDYSAIGYITKPIDPDALRAALERVQSKDAQRLMRDQLDVLRNAYNNPNAFEKISISSSEGIHFINIKDILYCEGDDNYTIIHLKTGERITASRTIKEYERSLQNLGFFRIHKQHLINLNAIQKYVRGEGGYVVLEGGARLDVSRRRRALFTERIKATVDLG